MNSASLEETSQEIEKTQAELNKLNPVDEETEGYFFFSFTLNKIK